MNVQQNSHFDMCNEHTGQYSSLPPKVTGNVCGFLTLKVRRIVWCLNSYKNVSIAVGWWGEGNPRVLRPCTMDGNKFGKIRDEIIYEIRTDPKTFEQYLRDCEFLELIVINEGVNVAIGTVSVPDLASIISKSRYGGRFSIIDEKGYTAGDIYISFDLYLFPKYSAKEISRHSNLKLEMHPYTRKEPFCKSIPAVLKSKEKDIVLDLQNEEKYNLSDLTCLFTWLSCDEGSNDDDDDDHKVLEQISKKRNIEKMDTELNYNDIHKEFYAGVKEATPPDVTGGTMWHREALKQANSIFINILSLSLNQSVVHQENTNMKNFKSKYNSLHRHIVNSSLPSKAAYFVEYEIPALLNMSTSKSDNSRNSRPWNRRIIRFCSKKQLGSEVYFSRSSVHHLPRTNGCWLENFKDLKIVVKIFLRNSNQHTPLPLGKATLEMCNVMNSESLSIGSETPVFSLAQVPHPFCIGKLKTKIELGRDCRYFGKEYLKFIMNQDSNTVKEGRIKKSETLSLQEKGKEAFEQDAHKKEQNKENLTKTEMKQQCVEKPMLLYALLYISTAHGFNAMNSYVVSKSLWKEDIAVSNICWETSSPNYNLREIIPVLLSTEFLERCCNNFLIVEAWERKPVAQNDALIGIAKLPLNHFFVAFRNPLLAEQLTQAKYPVVGVEGWVNIFNPLTRLQVGRLHAVLCLGTEDQIQLFERVRGIMETSYVPARMQPYNSKHYDFPSFAEKHENFIEVSVAQCQLNTDPKQSVSSSKSAHRGEIDESGKEVPSNVHQQNKIYQENAIAIQSDNQNVTYPSETPLTKQQHGSSCVPNVNASSHSLQQKVVENNSIQNHMVHELSQSEHQESGRGRSADQNFDITSGISVAKNANSNELETDKQQSNLDVTKAVDNNVFSKQTCPVKNQQCQTDVFVLDLQHYGPDFLTKHNENVEPLIIKLSSRGLEVIEMNKHNVNAEILSTTKCHSDSVKDKTDQKRDKLQLPKKVAFLNHHDHQSLSNAGENTFAFSFSAGKEHDMLNSGDDPVAHKHDNGGDSDNNFSIDNHKSSRNNENVVNNDHKIKSVDADRENKTISYSDQNSMKQHSTSAADGIINSKKQDYCLKCNMAHVCINNFNSDQSEGEKDLPRDSIDSQSRSVCVSDSSNVIMDNYGLNKQTIKPNISEQPASFSIKKSYALENTVDVSNTARQEISLSRNEIDTEAAKHPNNFKTSESPSEASYNAQLSSCTRAAPEHYVLSASSNFCAHIAVHQARNLSFSESDESERSVYVSFHLNYGCAKVIVDGEVQLRTGLLLTPVVPCNGNPVWNWHCEAWLPSDLLTDTSKQLTMKIWQKNNKSGDADPSADVLLGTASIDLTVILLEIPWICDWFSIVNFTGSCVGQIKMSVKPQENLNRFKPDKMHALIDRSIHHNINYLQAANGSPETREQYHAHVQKINCHLPKRLPDRNINSTKHKKTLSKAFVPLEWDLDFPEDTTFLLTNALRQKLSELDEITKRLQRRLLSVTSENVAPTCLDWEQEEADVPYCVKSNQKQKSIASVQNCAEMCTEAKVDSLKDESLNATRALLHRSCCCTELSSTSHFKHCENVCHLKHWDHLSDKMNLSKSSNILDNETSHEQLQSSCEKISEYQTENQDVQCSECDADLEIGENYLEDYNKEGDVNRGDDVEDFDALTDALMETAAKELDIANVFNPLLFQQLLLNNTNVMQRKCQTDKYSKHANVHNLTDSQSGSEIMLKYDETFLTVSTMKNNVCFSSEDNNVQCSENLSRSDLNSAHAVFEMDKFKKLENHIVSQKQPTHKRDLSDVPEINKQLLPLVESSNITQSSFNTVQTSSNLEKKQCKPQLHHQLKIPINGHSYAHEPSISNKNEVQERFSEPELNENIESNKEEIQNYSDVCNATGKQKLLQGNVKEAIKVTKSQAKNEGCYSEECSVGLQRKQKQSSRVCRLAPLFFQKLNTERE